MTKCSIFRKLCHLLVECPSLCSLVSYSEVGTCQVNGIFQSGISHRNVLPCSFHGLQICCHLLAGWLAGCVVVLLRSGYDAIMELRITILKHLTCFLLSFSSILCVRTVVVSSTRRNQKKTKRSR